jgi:Ca2+-binding RTX toxin-like protein
VGKMALVAALVLAAFPSNAFGAAVSLDDSGGVTYTAASGELNVVEVSAIGNAPGTITIGDSGAVITAGLGCDQVSAHEAMCSGANRADVRLGDLGDTATLIAQDSNSIGFRLFGGDGDDHLSECALCLAALVGGSGADTLQGGDVGAGLWGGDGPDSLTGGAYYDGIRGGRGKDTIEAGGQDDSIVPGGGDDLVDGGAGNDSLHFAAPKRRVLVDLRLGTATGQGAKTLVGIEDVVATNGADKLYGDGARNAFNGVGGDDLLVGRGGDDSLCGCGGGGDDRLFGGSGSDYLSAYLGADLLVGGPDGDVMRPGGGHDRVFGRGGDDDFYARDKFRDLLFGGRGADKGRVDRRLDVTRSIKLVPYI